MNILFYPEKYIPSVDIEIEDVIHQMNELPNKKRWKLIAQIFRECKFDDIETISEGEKFAIWSFLEKNFRLYKFGNK